MSQINDYVLAHLVLTKTLYKAQQT